MAEQRSDQILDAALDAIVEQGSSKVTLEAVGRRIGVTKSAIYHYFPNKRGMLRALFLREINRTLAQMESAAERSKSPEAKLRAVITARYDYLNRQGGFSSWSLETLLDIEPLARELLPVFRDAEQELCASIARQGEASGAFTVASPNVVAAVLVSCLHGLDGDLLLVRNARGRKDRIETFIQLLFDGLLTRRASDKRVSKDRPPSRFDVS
jgi:AcrR family transcriptional regulator